MAYSVIKSIKDVNNNFLSSCNLFKMPFKKLVLTAVSAEMCVSVDTKFPLVVVLEFEVRPENFPVPVNRFFRRSSVVAEKPLPGHFALAE